MTQSHLLTFSDENEICLHAIEHARINSSITNVEDLKRYRCLDRWSYNGMALETNQQWVGMLRSLRSILTEALRKPTTTHLSNGIEGPLTWRSFHQLLHVQNQHPHLDEQISGPQPIPYMITGFEREWITLAPLGLKYWDKFCLEPYSKGKNILYLCVTPDHEYICSNTKYYLRELSTSYELCRLGFHRPCLNLFADQGLVRISQRQDDGSDIDRASLPHVDSWFTDQQIDHPLGDRMKLYAQLLKYKLGKNDMKFLHKKPRRYISILGPILSNQKFDVSLFDENISRRDSSRFSNDLSDSVASNNDFLNQNSTNSPSSSSSSSLTTPVNSANGHYMYSGSSTSQDTSNILLNSTTSSSINGQHSADSSDLHAFESYYHGACLSDDQIFLVIYLIDAFRYNITEKADHRSLVDENLDTYIKKSLYRAYLDLIKDLPEKNILRIHVQVRSSLNSNNVITFLFILLDYTLRIDCTTSN